MIETDKQAYYTGVSTDIDRRFLEHLQTHLCAAGLSNSKASRGAKFFRSQKPEKIVYRRRFESRAEAQREEYRIKQLGRKQKLKLVELFNQSSPAE